MTDKISRRNFLRMSAMAAAGSLLAACAQPAAQIVEKPVTVVVEKEVPVQQQVVQTVLVEKEVAVEKVVKETVLVEKQQVVEKVITATPIPVPKEAPMLAELVKAGKLPPLEQRLPSEPMVIDLPWSQVGKYGGTLRRVATAAQFDDIQVYMYGESPIHWTNGGTGTGPGLFKGWDVNPDATEWTFYIRRGLKWSDGEPFTVDDILFWWEDMALDEGHSEAVPDYAKVGGKNMEVTKVDDFTAKFKFAASAPLTDFQLAGCRGFGCTNSPQPKHYMQQFHPKYNTALKDYETFYSMQYYWQNPDHPVMTAWKPIKLDVGQRLLLERNPYYYMVDKEGNQLPYIDRMEVTYAEDLEVVKLKIINGQIDFLGNTPILALRDLSLLKENEAKGGYHVELWDNGAGGAPAWAVNWNMPDLEKQALIRKTEFRVALSHAINRLQIKKMLYFGLGGPPSTGTVSPNCAQFNRSDEGKAIFAEWRDHASAYDPDKAKALLDQAGAVDVNGDGWRELPSGKELKFVIYNNDLAFVEAADMLKEDWRAVGLDCAVSQVSGQQIGTDWNTGKSDVRIWAGGAPDGPDILAYSPWLISYSNGGRWAPLYGQWMALEGTPKEGVDADKPPHDRVPPWDEPPADDPNRQMWEIYKKAVVEPDMKKRDQMVFDIVRIHIDQGPFLLGMIADLPAIVIVGNKLKNVPTHDQIPLGGWVGPWLVSEPGAVTYPEQYYYES